MKKYSFLSIVALIAIIFFASSCSDSHSDDGCHECHLETTINDTLHLWEIENASGGHEFCGDELTVVEAPGYEHVLTDTLVNAGGDTLFPGTYSEALNGYEVHCEEHAH